jgi:hypothetical protein
MTKKSDGIEITLVCRVYRRTQQEEGFSSASWEARVRAGNTGYFSLQDVQPRKHGWREGEGFKIAMFALSKESLHSGFGSKINSASERYRLVCNTRDVWDEDCESSVGQTEDR